MEKDRKENKPGVVTVQQNGTITLPDTVPSGAYELIPQGQDLKLKRMNSYTTINIPQKWIDQTKQIIQEKNLDKTIDEFFTEATKKLIQQIKATNNKTWNIPQNLKQKIQKHINHDIIKDNINYGSIEEFLETSIKKQIYAEQNNFNIKQKGE